MEGEDPKQHDFNQRHDGPFERPSLQIRRPSTDGPTNDGPTNDGPSSPSHPPEPESGTRFETPPVSPVGRKSIQRDARRSLQAPRRSMQASRKSMQASRRSMQERRISSDPMAHPPRTSTQLSEGGAGRPSRDFDIRRDGPFGRPSLTMTRRRSSVYGLGSPDSRRPTEAFEEKDRPEQPSPPDVDAVAPSVETLQSTDYAFEPEPPPLNYSLRTRKWSLIIFWSLILIDCIAMPLGLYFGLWYGVDRSDLSANAVFSIVTAALGGVSIIEYVLRLRRLFVKNSTCRPIGAPRMYFDWFHWNFSLGWVIIIVELIVGTIPEHPPIRLLSMPAVSMLYAFGTELIIVDILRIFAVPAPVRLSSIPKGSQLRPCVYNIIEDICAVDGSGGTAFREALNRRYEASHIFRAMLRRLGVFWAIGAEGAAVVFTVLIFTIHHEAAYVVGWTAPFVWAGVWTWLTYLYVTYMLKKEKAAWAEEVAAKTEEGGASGTSEVVAPAEH